MLRAYSAARPAATVSSGNAALTEPTHGADPMASWLGLGERAVLACEDGGGNECVRGRPLHGGTVTQPTDTRRARLPVSAVPGLYQAPGSHSEGWTQGDSNPARVPGTCQPSAGITDGTGSLGCHGSGRPSWTGQTCGRAYRPSAAGIAAGIAAACCRGPGGGRASAVGIAGVSAARGLLMRQADQNLAPCTAGLLSAPVVVAPGSGLVAARCRLVPAMSSC
jgi:hypothetical protein